MGVLEAFVSTWSQTRDTFGRGVPRTGEPFDQSAALQRMQSAVASGAPDSLWTGAAADSYQVANAKHGRVFGQMAELDRKLGAKISESAHIVSTGRKDVDAVRQWVLDVAATVPEGRNRDRLLMGVVNNGLGRLTEIITGSNSELNRVGGEISTIDTGYRALRDEIRFGLPEGPELDGAEQHDAGGEHQPEDMAELVRRALAGDRDAAAEVNGLLDDIDERQLGPNSIAHPLDPLRAELVGQLQGQMKPMSMGDLNAARERLGDNRGMLANAMQVMSDPDVSYPRHDGDGVQIVSPEPVAGLPNRGVMPGDIGALPNGVQQVLNEKSDFSGPPSHGAGYPGTQTDLEGADRHRSAENLKNLADIVGDGDARFQQGSQLDREMMSNAKEWLASQEPPGGGGTEHWGDAVVERVFETAGRDTVVNHDMLTTDGDFLQDVLTHEWRDDGQSARTLTDWIAEDAYSLDPVVNERAGETASAIADYLGDPAAKDALMNTGTGSQPNLSLGQMNPELTQSLANAMSPYVDEMAGRPIDSSTGWTAKDGDADLSYPHAAQIMGVLGTDPGAAAVLDSRAAFVQGEYITQYADAVTASNGQSGDSAAMEAAGRMKGIWDEGAYMSVADTASDEAKARQAAWDRQQANYSAAFGLVGSAPYVGPALELQSQLMADAILGPRPGDTDTGHTPIEGSLEMRAALASHFLAENVGDPAQLEALRQLQISNGGALSVPPETDYHATRDDFENKLNTYFSTLPGPVNDPLTVYEQAYRDVIR